jgi:undecaprenyl-phosphate 4-deoxy-4-formamido-L-arabinose transferase
MASSSISVVVPIYNEAANLNELYARLTKVLSSMQREYDIVLVDDGSSDQSPSMMQELSVKDLHVRSVILSRNFGQHGAVCAGFSEARGEIIVTLDADLQNPPEEIPKLVSKIEEGFDVVGGIRSQRKDPLLRKIISFFTTRLASLVVGKQIRDCGSMLRAYRRHVIVELLELKGSSIFIPAMTASLAQRFTEIPVEHHQRNEGSSKYNIFRFMLIFFDLITGYSAIPVQLVSLAGFFTSGCGFFLGISLLIRRLMYGPDVSQGVFTLMAILFVLMGLLLLALGLLGEYICRIYLEVRGRPNFRIRTVHSAKQHGNETK